MSNIEVNVLASSSSGNATLVRSERACFLIDMGVTYSYLKRSLESLNLQVGDIDAVFITHEHIDHVKGLDVLSKHINAPIFVREKCFDAIFHRIKQGNFELMKEEFDFRGISVSFFSIPHDAVDPIGYMFVNDGSCFSYVTDIGEVTSDIKYAVDASDMLVLESNHDVGMLKNGSYPPYLKRRILSSYGHLSNECAALTLLNSRLKKRKVILAHLSERNNCIDVLKKTYKNILCNAKLPFKIKIARPYDIVSYSI